MRLHIFLFEPSHWEGFLLSLISGTRPLTVCLAVCMFVVRCWPPPRVSQKPTTSVSVSAIAGPGPAVPLCGKQAGRVLHTSSRWQHWHMCCWIRETLSGPTQPIFQSVQKCKKHDETDRLWSRTQLFHLAHLPVTQIRAHSHQEPVVDVDIVNGVQSHHHCLKRPS